MRSARSPASQAINPAPTATAGIISVAQRAHCTPAMLRAVAHSTSPGGQLRMPAPTQLGYQATHRVTKHDEPLDAQHRGQPSDVIGALLQPVGPRTAQPAPMPALIEGQHPEAPGPVPETPPTS
jgi:hypothetical protein